MIMLKKSVESDNILLRHHMVEEQLRKRGIKDERLLAVMEAIPRHLFVPECQQEHAYADSPLPIDANQTISQPYMVARMTELLELKETSRVLEVGTGSGYQTAVLAELAGHVWTVERIPALARRAERLLRELGYSHVHVITGDGSAGLDEGAPYDAIIVTAAAPCVPDPLLQQLAADGRMVIPVTAGHVQELRLIERLADTHAASGDSGKATDRSSDASSVPYRETTVLRCVFVPLVGVEGYPA